MIRGLKNLRHVRNSQQICLSSKYYSAKVNFIFKALSNVTAYFRQSNLLRISISIYGKLTLTFADRRKKDF